MAQYEAPDRLDVERANGLLTGARRTEDKVVSTSARWL
jgi:hypothetical protein